jgi:hypothetical protein
MFTYALVAVVDAPVSSLRNSEPLGAVTTLCGVPEPVRICIPPIVAPESRTVFVADDTAIGLLVSF